MYPHSPRPTVAQYFDVLVPYQFQWEIISEQPSAGFRLVFSAGVDAVVFLFVGSSLQLVSMHDPSET